MEPMVAYSGLKPLWEELGELEKWLKRLAEEEPENSGAYRVLSAVYAAQAAVLREALQRLEEGGWAEKIRSAARKVAFSRKPLLELLGGLPGPLLDEEWLNTSLQRIARAALDAGMRDTGRAAPLLAPVEKALLSTRELVEEALQGREDLVNAWAGAVSGDRDQVRALVYWLLQPLLEAVRLAAGKALDWASQYWQQGTCPVCGAPSRTGFMAGEGRRLHLVCSLCGMVWVFPRARCPRCGAEKPGSIVYYTPIPGRQWLRLYTCKQCGYTWRVVDEEHSDAHTEGLPPRRLYEVYTAPLDYVAEKIAGSGGSGR